MQKVIFLTFVLISILSSSNTSGSVSIVMTLISIGNVVLKERRRTSVSPHIMFVMAKKIVRLGVE